MEYFTIFHSIVPNLDFLTFQSKGKPQSNSSKGQKKTVEGSDLDRGPVFEQPVLLLKRF